MNVLLINLILSTATAGVIKRRDTNHDTMIYNFARGFVAAGHKVTIAASDEFKPLLEEDNPFEVVYFPSRLPAVFKPHLLPWPKGLCKFLKMHGNEFDMILSVETFSLATLIATQVCGKKVMIWQEMSLHQHLFFQLPSKIWYNLVPRLFYKCNLVVPISEPAREFVSRYCRNVSCETIRHGANAEVLYPSDDTDNSFIIVARLDPLKRIDTMIAKFAALLRKPEYADYMLHIVGDGEHEADLKKLTHDLGIESNVAFHGFMTHNKLAPLMRRAKALLINTAIDLNMVSVPESIVSGTPVVMNTVPTSASFVNESGVGIARDDWDETDLIKIIEDYDRYHNACLAVRDSLTNVGCAKRMVAIFEKWHSR